MDDILAQYYEDLLRLQYQVSENIVQMLPRGTVREDFLRDIILNKRDSLRIKKGIIAKGSVQSGECDHIYYNQSATVNRMGDQVMIDPKYVSLVVEIKSNATGLDIKKSNLNFHKIKSLDPENVPKCGVFCYNTTITKKTVLSRFGFSYDNETLSWKESESPVISYPDTDFITNVACLCADEDRTEEQYFLIKDDLSGKYTLLPEYPIIKNFFSIIENI